jgi:hypothetical protein
MIVKAIVTWPVKGYAILHETVFISGRTNDAVIRLGRIIEQSVNEILFPKRANSSKHITFSLDVNLPGELRRDGCWSRGRLVGCCGLRVDRERKCIVTVVDAETAARGLLVALGRATSYRRLKNPKRSEPRPTADNARITPMEYVTLGAPSVRVALMVRHNIPQQLQRGTLDR